MISETKGIITAFTIFTVIMVGLLILSNVNDYKRCEVYYNDASCEQLK